MPYKDPEKVKAHNRAYYKSYYYANKQRKNATTRAYYAAHRDELRVKDKAYRLAHIVQKQAQNKATKDRIKKEVYEAYGGFCCICCGETNEAFLSIDHINGGGTQHRRQLQLSSGSSFYRWLKRQGFPPGYRVLCMNCNCAIGHSGYCPHGNLPNISGRIPEDTQQLPLFESAQSLDDSR